MKILKLKADGLKGFKNHSIELDFFAEKRVSSEEVNENVTQLINRFYTLNTLSLVGINASGKTSTLNVIHGILSIFINNESINSANRLFNHIDRRLNIEIFLADDNLIYKLNSIIIKDENSGTIWFEDETLYTSKLTSSFKKSDLSGDFKYIEKMERKSLDSRFLKNDDSIFSGILNLNRKSNYIMFDTMSQTNFNYLAPLHTLSTSFIEYLDSSIEQISRVNEDKDPTSFIFNIKFKDDDRSIQCEWMDLEKYLSSGTIKGLNILAMAVKAMVEGGYLIVDELENHLNKRIVTSILEFFLSDLNKNGATLIFSTHYVEILDTIDRSDSIYVLDKKREITVEKLSTLLGENDRNDRKKSDIFLSGMVNTVPNYNHYRAIKKEIKNIVENGSSNYGN